MAMQMCRQTKSNSVHAHVHKTDLPIDITERHARYCIDTDETRFPRGTFSIHPHFLKLLCTLHKKTKVMCIIPRHNDTRQNIRLFEGQELCSINARKHVSGTVKKFH
jgi:hypothetical protein